MPPGLLATGDNVETLTNAVSGKGTLARTSLGRVGINNDCPGALVYLASDESASMSGQRLCVGGSGFRWRGGQLASESRKI